MKCTKCDGDGWIGLDLEGRYIKCGYCENGIIVTDDIPRLADPFRDPKLSWLRRNDDERGT
jgi:DNA-directed RNA polymerase subunit RPC12/RpoP